MFSHASHVALNMSDLRAADNMSRLRTEQDARGVEEPLRDRSPAVGLQAQRLRNCHPGFLVNVKNLRQDDGTQHRDLEIGV